MRSGHIRVTPGSFLQGAYSFAPIARKFRYCIAAAAAKQQQQQQQQQEDMVVLGEAQARSKAAHPSQSTMPSPEAPKLHSAHGHMPKIQSAHSSTLQRHQHPSSQAHTAAALCNAPAPKLPSAPCGGTSAQARARKHAALPTLEQQRHPAEAPAPTLENAHMQLFLYLNEVRTLIAHAVC